MHVELLMAPAEGEKIFLRAAVDSILKVAEIVCGFSPEDQSGALDAAERRFVKAARDYGCTEISARFRVSAIMRLLRRQVKARQASEAKLRALLQKLTEPN
jgi:hypothetical protein